MSDEHLTDDWEPDLPVSATLPRPPGASRRHRTPRPGGASPS
jgi:hypothetical protein